MPHIEEELTGEPNREMEPKVTLEDALEESSGAGLVYKPDTDHLAKEIEEYSRRRANFDDETKKKLEGYEGGSRLLGHLFRLLESGRSDAEHALANLILDHYRELSDERMKLLDDEEAVQKLFKEQGRIEDFEEYFGALMVLRKVPEGDCADTVAWWTFSPYLAEVMHEKGVDDKTALARLMDWGMPAAAKDGIEPNTVHLPGLDFLADDSGEARSFILSTDPEGPSHKFARQKAEQVIKGHVV